MAEELRPCPFCGGEADVHYFAHDDSECTVMCSNSNCRASVSSRSCGSMTTAYNRARKLWNRRAERTCRIKLSKTSVWHCDGCGQTIDGNCFADNGGRLTEYRFCPNCGAKVVDE